MFKQIRIPGVKSFQRNAAQLGAFLQGSFRVAFEEIRSAREKMKDLVKTNYDLGIFHLEKGNVVDAAFRFQMLLRFQPDNIAGTYQLGRCYYLQGKNDKAQHCFNKVLAAQPAHAEAQYMLALLQGRTDIQELPIGVVRDYFNHIADEYDAEYVQNQEYRGHEKCFETAKRALENGQSKKVSILDLGCGTGLCAALFRESEMAIKIKGIDVSPRMLEHARKRLVHERSTYNFVKDTDIHIYLNEADETYDLVVAAGVLEYIGDLAPVFEGVSRRLEAGGLWVLTVQKGEGASYRMLPSLESFSHSASYVENVAEKAQLELLTKEEFMLYKDKSALVYAFRKKSA